MCEGCRMPRPQVTCPGRAGQDVPVDMPWLYPSYAMKVLGRVLASPFDAFWDLFGTETDVAQELIEGGHEAVFEPECYREDSAGRPRFPAPP